MTTWYAAHIVMVVEFTRARQDAFPAWENVVLIAADSEDEAYRKADRYGHSQEGDDDGTFRWGGRQASWKFAGVRKLTDCAFRPSASCDLAEVTYIDLEFSSRKAIENYIAGHDQRVMIRDPFPDDPKTPIVANGAKRTHRRKAV